MPETRLAATRRTLPEGYQFGDNRAPRPAHCWSCGLPFSRLATTTEDLNRCRDCFNEAAKNA